MTTHTLEILEAMDLAALRELYNEVIGHRPGRRAATTMINAILAAQQTAGDPTPADDPEPAEQAQQPAQAETSQDEADSADMGPHRAEADPQAPQAGEAARGQQEADSALERANGDQPSEPVAEPEPIEPQRVRVIGYGAYAGSEMTCSLLLRTPTSATVQVVDARIRFRLDDGRIATKRQGWTETGWRLDLDSLPERGEFTAEELDALPPQELTTEQLRDLYERTLQRPTGSSHRGYLAWKIREARKGNIKVGPSERRAGSDAEMKVVSMRMERATVKALDEAWKRRQYPNRIAFIRAALVDMLQAHGEDEVAELIK